MDSDVVIAIQEMCTMPDPVIGPLLHRGIDIDSCRKWFSKVVGVPNVYYNMRNEATGALVQLSLMSEKPILLYQLNSGSKSTTLSPPPVVGQLIANPSHDNIPIPRSNVLHLMFDARSFMERADR